MNIVEESWLTQILRQLNKLLEVIINKLTYRKGKRHILLSFFIFCLHIASSQNIFEDIKIQSALLSLDYQNAKEQIKTYSDADNKIYKIVLEDKLDFMQIMLEQDPKNFENLKTYKDKRIDQLENLDDYSGLKDWALSEIYLNWALCRIRMGEFFMSAWELNRAKNHLEKIPEDSKASKLSLKTKGLINCFISIIPVQYMWIAETFGYKGNIEQGLVDLSNYTNSWSPNHIGKADGQISIALIEAFFNENSIKAKQGLNKMGKFPLIEFIKILVAHREKNTQNFMISLELLNSFNVNKSIPYITYLNGLSKLYSFDLEGVKYFNDYVNYFKGHSYKSDALEKCSWLYLINNDTLNYINYKQRSLSYNSQHTDADLNAKTNSLRSNTPNINLLKSRILFDAGLYKKSMAELEDLSSKVISNKYERTELIYRLARNHHLLDKKEKAIEKYKETIESSKGLKAYFSASAAYYLARIYEKEKMYSDSKKYYTLCLKFKNHSYKRSFDIKAKSGLHRITQIDNNF